MQNNIKHLFLSRIFIKNFRNFGELDLKMTSKQIIIGENNVGKSNLIRAIQLILDPSLSEQDRHLKETDFFDGLEEPQTNGKEIIISIELQGFEHNKQLKALLCDAIVNENPFTARITYKYKIINPSTKEYGFVIYQGEDEEISFGYRERKVLNFMVIDAIRDVESDLKSEKRSPIKKLIKRIDISDEKLKDIAEAMKGNNDEILKIDEISILIKSINKQLSRVTGSNGDVEIDLQTNDIIPSRVLNNINLSVGSKARSVKDSSLGINNLIYISLLMMHLEDDTVPKLLNETAFNDFIGLQNGEHNCLLKKWFLKNDENYILKDSIPNEEYMELYEFFDENRSNESSFTLLAIEEPEAHLHPSVQRTVYREVMKENTSILVSTHSPFITSIAPIKSIVHLIPSKNKGTNGFSTSELTLSEREMEDLQRYIDVKRGELYFGKGVILVEGVAEEYLIPRFAELMGIQLDIEGIICCNINGTDFKPYITFFKQLGVPYVVITDGDYYYYNKEGKKVFNEIYSESHENYGYDGIDRMRALNEEVGLFPKETLNEKMDFNDMDKIFNENHIFIGNHTLETDIMECIEDCEGSKNILFDLFESLTSGGDGQKANFKTSYNAGEYDKCLAKIESSHSKIGKGRFAQSLASKCTSKFNPSYVKNAIEDILKQILNKE
ncbi:ATP-dependent nuclease [Lysinibacillus fusiformis]|uniref:ATP-dependent nuclease n=1 Tax=Lysinibacillus fusiformis TaxID=28031 RepID=UPI0009F4FDB6|nr:AAA family ATPase [Lysinibacillus fusiformis]